MKIKYDVTPHKIRKGWFKHETVWRLYKNVIGYHSIGCKKIYEGSQNDCYKYADEHNIDLKQVVVKN